LQEANGPAAAAANAAAAAALSNSQKDAPGIVLDNPANGVSAGAAKAPTDAAVSEDAALAGAGIKPGVNTAPAASQPHRVTSSSLKAIMGTVPSAPAPAARSPGLLPAAPEVETPSSSVLKTMLGVSGCISGGGGGGGGSYPSGAPSPAPPAAAPERPVGYDPKIGVPQLLLERGGRIRITALWEAYRLRFGETQYTLKDLFCESRFMFELVCGRGRVCRETKMARERLDKVSRGSQSVWLMLLGQVVSGSDRSCPSELAHFEDAKNHPENLRIAFRSRPVEGIAVQVQVLRASCTAPVGARFHGIPHGLPTSPTGFRWPLWRASERAVQYEQ